MYLALAAIFMAVVFLFMVVTPPRGRETGFKQCNKCGKNKMSLTDPHTLCFRCLGPDHLYQSCNQCKGLLPDSRSRRARRQIIWKVSQLLDPPPQKLSQMAARELALTYMSHTQVQEYTVFGNSGGTRDEDCVDSNSLAGQGDAVHTGVALLASSDRGPVSRLTLDSFGFDAHFANGKEMSHGSTGARQGRYTLDAPRGGSMAFDPARTSDGRPPIGTVQGPSLLAGGAEASARSCSDPFAAASNAWQSRGLESQGTFDSNLSRQVPIDVPTPVPGTSTLPFGFVEAFQPVSRVETTVVDLTRMVQENVQQALGGVDRKIDLIFKAMANMSTGVPGLGGVEPIDPPQLQIDPLLAPIPLGPRDLGKVDPVRDKVPLGGSAASMSGIDVSQSTARPLERAPDNWSYDRTMSHYLTKLGATDMVSRPAPVVDPMLHIAGQTRSTAAPGGLLLDESRAKMLSSIFGAPEAVARTAPGNSRFRMEPELFSKAFVAPQLDGAIADKIKRANKGFVPRSEVNHWVAALGPLYESAMASFRLAYHQLWMIRGLHTDLDVSPPEHQAALVQHLMASALESLTNSARGAVNTLVLLRSMLLSLTDYSKEKSVQSRLTALPFRGTLVFGEDFLALLKNLSADTLALKQSDQVLSGPTPAKIPRVLVQPPPIKAKRRPNLRGSSPNHTNPSSPFEGAGAVRAKLPPKAGVVPSILAPLVSCNLPGLLWRAGDVAMLRPLPVGGRLSQFLPAWESLTSDQWILEIVREGYKLPFVTPPRLSLEPLETHVPRDRSQEALLREEIQALLDKQAIEEIDVRTDPLGFYSHYFLASKKTGGFRPILNLRGLNQHIRCDKFRMDTLQTILQALAPGDWMVSLDLKDAYLHVPIFLAHRKFLRFAFKDPLGILKVYQWMVLPFGLSTSPRVFTKVLAPIGAALHAQGHSMFPYIDDLFSSNARSQSTLQSRDACITLLLQVGFIINLKKSNLIPTQDMVHLGARLLTEKGIVLPPQDKVDVIVTKASTLRETSQTSARDVLHVTGLMTACIQMVPHCMLYVRPLTMHLLRHYTPGRDSIQKLISVDDRTFRRALSYWTEETNLLRGVPLGSGTPKVVISTDASLQGWGAAWGCQTVKGIWDYLDRNLHINLLEMKAVLLALSHFQEQIRGSSVLIQSDNTTVVAYINRDGGMRSPSLNAMVRNLVDWSTCYLVTVRAVHVAGADNVQADVLSREGQVQVRNVSKSTEWSLAQSVIDKVFRRWDLPDVDLFATRLNRKVDCFCSLLPDALARSHQALSIPWDKGLMYIYPPMSLALRSLAKIAREEADAIVILPCWPRRGWFHLLIQLSIELPILLPQSKQLLTGPEGVPHPDLATLRLAAWRVSGKTSKQQEFRSKLQTHVRLLCDLPQNRFIMLNGKRFVVGVLNGISIPLTRL